jgi:hypothetical protein
VRQRLASRSVFAARVWRSSLSALVIVAVALAVGMAGYAWFGGMGPAQAFANAAMILSGMGPLDQLKTTGGFIFEGIYALVCGLIFFAVAGLIPCIAYCTASIWKTKRSSSSRSHS